MSEHSFTAKLEAQLVDLWRDALGIQRVGVDDNFFELGGDSLVATRLVANARRRLGIEIPLRLLFENPTIAELAHSLQQRQRTPTEPAERTH